MSEHVFVFTIRTGRCALAYSRYLSNGVGITRTYLYELFHGSLCEPRVVSVGEDSGGSGRLVLKWRGG